MNIVEKEESVPVNELTEGKCRQIDLTTEAIRQKSGVWLESMEDGTRSVARE
jgi:hypothetical protein